MMEQEDQVAEEEEESNNFLFLFLKLFFIIHSFFKYKQIETSNIRLNRRK